MDAGRPLRQIRARYDDHTITVYQAYAHEIADAALAGGGFVPPFKLDRMTWIKPSFRWMMYRSGWATKARQERILGIEMTRTGFEWALEHSVLSHFEPGTYADLAAWKARKESTPVRIQWDPERDLHLQPLDHRAVQVGLGGEAARRFVETWVTSITDLTPLTHRIHRYVAERDLDSAAELLPRETTYPVPASLAATIGMTGPGLPRRPQR